MYSLLNWGKYRRLGPTIFRGRKIVQTGQYDAVKKPLLIT